MIKTIIRRLIIMVPQLFVIMLVTFALQWMMPGDFVSNLVGSELTWQEIEAQRVQLGLDNPWYYQFWNWFTSVLRFDFGISAQHHRPVVDVIGERLSNTFWLSLAQTILLFALAIPLGIIAGRFARRWPDKLILLYGFIGMSLPVLVYAIILIFFFGFNLQWLPVRGSIDPVVVGTGAVPELLSRLRHLILPTIAGATLTGVGMIYTLRIQIVDGSVSEYAKTARSKGVPSKVIFNKHILRNSLIPFAQGIGFTFIGLLSGTIFIEQIFSYPGMGQLFLNSIQIRDFAVASTLVLFYSFLSVIGVLIGDIAVTVADPRIHIK